MSYYSLPILVLNLGGEMFYVLDQRLKAQKVPQEKAQKVLNEIATLMLDERFINEIFKPQQLYNKEELFLLFREIAHASIMKLNENSMGKLYDLMIMVFKYQLFFASQPYDVLLITLNHLDSLRRMVSSPDVYKQLDLVYALLANTYYCMQNAALQRIRYDLLNYFQDIHVKVSIFLRLGQQNNDGTFIRPNIEDVPSGFEIPGIIKIFNEDESIKDMIAFSPGGEYIPVHKNGSLEFNGNREITLGTSVYREKSLTQDFSWTSENSLESQIVQNAKNCIYRSEINSLMTQLLGCKCEESENETILLDLCAKNEKETKVPDKLLSIKTITLSNSSEKQNMILNSVASEVTSDTEEMQHNKNEDLLYLLENTQ